MRALLISSASSSSKMDFLECSLESLLSIVFMQCIYYSSNAEAPNGVKHHYQHSSSES